MLPLLAYLVHYMKPNLPTDVKVNREIVSALVNCNPGCLHDNTVYPRRTPLEVCWKLRSEGRVVCDEVFECLEGGDWEAREWEWRDVHGEDGEGGGGRWREFGEGVNEVIRDMVRSGRGSCAIYKEGKDRGKEGKEMDVVTLDRKTGLREYRRQVDGKFVRCMVRGRKVSIGQGEKQNPNTK